MLFHGPRLDRSLGLRISSVLNVEFNASAADLGATGGAPVTVFLSSKRFTAGGDDDHSFSRVSVADKRCATLAAEAKRPETAWKALNNIDPQRDIEFVLGPVDSLDHASRLPDFGSKMGVDSTRKWPSEGFNRPWPKVIRMNPEVEAKVEQLWKKAGLK